ncbi:MAG: glycerol-3-phosphate dehydrogenase/oxidase [Myxococcales bacterium]|nr:glycerol-3-phosphate dehydrogenase/oxidase [Myxococcales bacterium]
MEATASPAVQTVDLVVIGGGITGAGIARDAALRGLSVVLFEKGDFGSGTSSKSSKLVHGGLRYLEHGEIGLVFESVSERRVQTQVAPHLVRPMPFLIPVYKGAKPSFEIMNLGLWIYDSLALFRAPRMHRTFRGAKAALEVEPQLREEKLRGALEYFDCATDDARLVLENVLDAQAAGARCHNYVEVTGLHRGQGGTIEAVSARDCRTGATQRVACKGVILAAGAWTDESIRKLEVPMARQLLRRTKGVHIVVPRERLPLVRAITLLSPLDGRVMFAIPWRERTVLGTTDTDFEGSADEVCADGQDVRYLYESANGYFPGAKLGPDDVISTWAGLRPLIRGEEDASESETSREHEVFVRDDGMVIIAGGKLTTYRRMAKQVVDVTVRALVARELLSADRLAPAGTKHRPLPGAVGLDPPTLEAVAGIGRELMARHGLDLDTATHLCGVYGVRSWQLAEHIAAAPHLGQRLDPELPYVWAEIDFAVQHDLAVTLEDVLARRVPLLLTSRDQGLGVCEAVAARMAELAAWSPELLTRNLEEYRHEVALSRRWQQG